MSARMPQNLENTACRQNLGYIDLRALRTASPWSLIFTSSSVTWSTLDNPFYTLTLQTACTTASLCVLGSFAARICLNILTCLVFHGASRCFGTFCTVRFSVFHLYLIWFCLRAAIFRSARTLRLMCSPFIQLSLLFFDEAQAKAFACETIASSYLFVSLFRIHALGGD